MRQAPRLAVAKMAKSGGSALTCVGNMDAQLSKFVNNAHTAWPEFAGGLFSGQGGILLHTLNPGYAGYCFAKVCNFFLQGRDPLLAFFQIVNAPRELLNSADASGENAIVVEV